MEGKPAAEVAGDRELLRRAFENVLRNAIRYSPEQAAIDVLLRRVQITTITVRDYGPRVREESLTQIFESFFHAEGGRDEETEGIDLGLSIAKRAVRLHRGTITAQNALPALRVQIVITEKNREIDRRSP